MYFFPASPKIELGRAEKFQQDQTDSGQELLLETIDPVKLDYEREEEPLVLEETEPTELYNYISEIAKSVHLHTKFMYLSYF